MQDYDTFYRITEYMPGFRLIVMSFMDETSMLTACENILTIDDIKG